MLTIDREKCFLCQMCVQSCPFGALEFLDGKISVNDQCTLCGSCVNVCRFQAIKIERKPVSREELEKFKGVYVWVENETTNQGIKPKKVAYELLSKGRSLANELGEELVAVVLGDTATPVPEDLADYGAERIILCRHELLAEYSTDGFATVLCALIAQKKPAIFLYGATPNGRDLAPRVAARLHLGLTADCTGLEIDAERQLVQTRPAFGGNILASIITPETRPQTATVRPNVFPRQQVAKGVPAVIENFPVVLKSSAIRTRVIERQKLESAQEVKISEADVIVAAGRGCQKPANLGLLEEFARLLGGTVAGTRAIVEEGWIGHERQVGQSGTTVSPKLYVAIGISGAVQHVVGMSSSGTIIAINKDPEAAIFKVADLGIVGDAMAILPRLNALLLEKSLQ